ncbi:hypothetical protein MLD38_036745 [Melastoma candidum]|uniref:Uncharacterized protein n=1 Tax=Melastoma candidum TaxID=119954 RepID=A0ACB9LLD0_9MYRT|nr:hypothetical protein MLD38_036745 [Melastoma candidum]
MFRNKTFFELVGCAPHKTTGLENSHPSFPLMLSTSFATAALRQLLQLIFDKSGLHCTNVYSFVEEITVLVTFCSTFISTVLKLSGYMALFLSGMGNLGSTP